jgi:hypothetical protein
VKTLNHSNARAISQLRGSIKCILIAAGLAAAVAAPAWAADLPDVVNWRTLMAHNSTPSAGCFHASYPNIVWEKVACRSGQPRAHPVHIKPRGDEPEVTGGILGTSKSNDYVAQATGLITEAVGSFRTRGVASETGVLRYYNTNGTPNGILGPNEYSIQLNTNEWETTSACAGHNGCTVWQQFVYATDYLGPGEAAVFMQYWLLNWGSSACPTGYNPSYGDCYANSWLLAVDDIPITDLESVRLTGSATAGGSDSAVLTYGIQSFASSFPDYVLDISSVWNKAEFNVVGNAGGSQADFNVGTSITVTLSLHDGSTSAPTCVANDGTTGESNNLNAGACTASGGAVPYIQFTESLPVRR